MNTTYSKILAYAAVLGISASGLQAQPTEADELALEEVIVTASKREERLIDVPMAIATMSGLELKTRGIDSIQDLSFAVPGLTMREDGPGSYQVFLRGIANPHGGGALVSIYQDEIPMVLTGYDVLPTRVLDLARVEVLKGPQGTLYGQGAVGGAVRYITNRPVLNEFSGSLEGEYYGVSEGETGNAFTAIMNVPLAETFAMRVAAEFRNGGGWQDQPAAGIEDGNGEELRNIRLRALWSPTDKLDILATMVSYNSQYELGQGYEQPDRTVYVATDPSLRLIPKIWDYDLFNLEVTYDFDGVRLLSSTSYSEMDHQYPFSYFGGPETIYEGALSGFSYRYNPGDQFTQELRLTSTGDGPFNWTIGGFYADMERSLDIPFGVTEFGGTIFPPFTYYSAGTSESYSIYADGSYQINEKWEVGAGVRYFEDDATGIVIGGPLKSGTFDSVDPRFYVTYAIDNDRKIYSSISKGFRSGGFNTGDLPDYDPESLWSYELGYKASLAGGALFLDAAVYYTKYDDMLRRGLIFISPEQGFQSLISNIGEVEVKGVEASLTWQATDALTIDFSGTIIDAEVTKLAAEGTANIVGDPIDYVPDYSFTLGARYDFNWSDNMPGYFRVNYSYRDKMPYVDRTSFPAENLPQFSDDIGLIDVRLGLRSGRVYAELYSQNLSDINKYIDPYGGWNNANRTRPRTVGVKVGVEF